MENQGFNKNAIIRRMYDRTIAWFMKTYGYQPVNSIDSPLIATSTFMDLESSIREEGMLLVSGPCMDHAVGEGAGGLSFQIALETLLLIKQARVMEVPILLLIMSPCLLEEDTIDTWNQLGEGYRSLVHKICRLVKYPEDYTHIVRIWEKDYVFEHMRMLHPFDEKSPLLRSLYQSSRPLDYVYEGEMNRSLIRSYHDNLLAYHPEVLRKLSHRSFHSLLHVENIQQIRAFYSASKWFGFNPSSNRQLVFVTTPSPNGGIRMSRAEGNDRLPAHLGKTNISNVVESSSLLKSFISSFATKVELDILVDIFVEC